MNLVHSTCTIAGGTYWEVIGRPINGRDRSDVCVSGCNVAGRFKSLFGTYNLANDEGRPKSTTGPAWVCLQRKTSLPIRITFHDSSVPILQRATESVSRKYIVAICDTSSSTLKHKEKSKEKALGEKNQENEYSQCSRFQCFVQSRIP